MLDKLLGLLEQSIRRLLDAVVVSALGVPPPFPFRHQRLSVSFVSDLSHGGPCCCFLLSGRRQFNSIGGNALGYVTTLDSVQFAHSVFVLVDPLVLLLVRLIQLLRRNR